MGVGFQVFPLGFSDTPPSLGVLQGHLGLVASSAPSSLGLRRLSSPQRASTSPSDLKLRQSPVMATFMLASFAPVPLQPLPHSQYLPPPQLFGVNLGPPMLVPQPVGFNIPPFFSVVFILISRRRVSLADHEIGAI